MNAKASVLCVLSLGFSLGAHAEEYKECWKGEGPGITRRIAGYELRIHRVKGEEPWPEDGYVCGADVLAADGTPVFHGEGAAIQLNEITGQDLNGDGKPEAVFESYSGGAHCCWTYWIVSLADPPGLIAKIENERPAAFEDLDGDGRLEIWTLDGAFDYFDCLSHAETPFPTVVLQLDGSNLKNISSKFWTTYQDEISKTKLSPQDVALLRSARNQEELCSDDRRKLVPGALSVVFAYLFGGRAQQAWKTLDEMWPTSDKDRIKGLILQTRKCGVLNYVYKTCAERDDGTLPDEKP